MAYRYNVYGTNEVESAVKNYNNVSNSAPVYSDSTTTNQARKQADSAEKQYLSTVNGGYSSAYTGSINELANKYNNSSFDWNAEGSTEYQGYKEKAKREGQRQMENTQGAYSANTGGYANSYAQAAGQRVYNQKMEELAEKIPSLRQTALNNWSDNQERTMNQISLLQGLDDTSYQRYRDRVSDRYNFLTYYQNKYSTEKGLDMSAFSNELSAWQSRMSAAATNLSNIRSLAESQYEHNTVSADTRAANESSRVQNENYYNYLNSRLNL